jgi:hypothetical protein
MTEAPDTFDNPGICRATLETKDVPGLCLLIEETCTFDVYAEYTPGRVCVTIEWFAAEVKGLTSNPITAEGLAAALVAAFQEACGPYSVSVRVTHHEKDGVVLVVTA